MEEKYWSGSKIIAIIEVDLFNKESKNHGPI